MSRLSSKSKKDVTRIHPAVIQTLIKVVESYGVDFQNILTNLNLNSTTVLNPEKRVVGSTVDDIWREAINITNDDAIGIKFANYFQMGAFNGLGFSWLASNNILDGFLRMSKYFKVISNAGMLEVKEGDKNVTVTLVLPVPYGIAENAGIDAALALFVKLCTIVSTEAIRPINIRMQRPKPLRNIAFTDFFKCSIAYNEQCNQLVFDKEAMLDTLPISNPLLARANDQVVENYLRKHEQDNMPSAVSSLIIEALPDGTPTISQIANKLFVSPKTLQRRLSVHEITYSSLLEDVRTTLATNYLLNDSYSISEICYLLGFSEPSNLTRWFKEHFGETPNQYKHKKRRIANPS